MKQIVQSLKTGNTEIVEFPSPKVKPGYILIQTTDSLVSIGTERTTVTGSKESLFSRAKKNPEKVLKLFPKKTITTRTIKKIKINLAAKLGDAYKLEVQIVDKINLSKSGKFKMLDQKLQFHNQIKNIISINFSSN